MHSGRLYVQFARFNHSLAHLIQIEASSPVFWHGKLLCCVRACVFWSDYRRPTRIHLDACPENSAARFGRLAALLGGSGATESGQGGGLSHQNRNKQCSAVLFLPLQEPR